MGTQQVIMIVLSVIVVGAAIAVGIAMFDTQSENSLRQSMAAEMLYMGIQARAFYRTPVMMGGAGYDPNKVTAAKVVNYIDHSVKGTNLLYTEIGFYTFQFDTNTSTNELYITGEPKDRIGLSWWGTMTVTFDGKNPYGYEGFENGMRLQWVDRG
jgi:hypothetical protein